MLVVSTLDPKGSQETLNVVEFFYPEEIGGFERDRIEARCTAYYLETEIDVGRCFAIAANPPITELVRTWSAESLCDISGMCM